MDRPQAIQLLAGKLTDHLMTARQFPTDRRPMIEQMVTEYYTDPSSNGAMDVQNLLQGQDIANIPASMAESGFIDWNRQRQGTSEQPTRKGGKLKAFMKTQTGRMTPEGLLERQAGLQYLGGE
jgi:hypothetical protein